MCERELTEREMAIEKEFQERKDREESKTVKPANQLVGYIGTTLERIHGVPITDIHIRKGYKSLVLCFSNGKTIHFDAEIHTCKDGVLPTIRLRDGDWEMLEAAPEELREPEQPEVKPPKELGEADLHEIDGANQD